MDGGKLELGIIFLAQTGVGVLGNSSLLCFYSFSLLTRQKLRSPDLILNQLALTSLLVLFSKGIPQTAVGFGWKHFLDDVGRQLVHYYYRVGTGVSLSTICLLNGFQAIKLTPSTCRWVELKVDPVFIGVCCFLCWIPHLLINSFIAVLMSAPSNSKNLTVRNSYGYCSWTPQENYSSLYAVLYFSPDLMSLIFMVCASCSTVLVLYRHKQRVQHIHSHRGCLRYSHEARATGTILVLVSAFVVLYSVCTVLTIWMTLVANPGQRVVNSSVLLASSFPAFSPFVLTLSDTQVSTLCFGYRRRKTALPRLCSGCEVALLETLGH